MRRTIRLAMLGLMLSIAHLCTAEARTLDIYFIDVEGGQSTLIVTPEKQSLLVDTGYPGDGKAPLRPGDPKQARDAQRILAATRDAGIHRIDYLLITHFHADHVGGVPELAQLLPIGTFVDHGTLPSEAETNVPGSMEVFAAYAAVRKRGAHLEPKPGEHLPLKGIEVIIVSSARATLKEPLSGASSNASHCDQVGLDAQDAIENPRSTGFRLRYGRFQFLDLGDLSGPPLRALACPKDMIGPVDVYLVAHHAGADAADRATFAAFKPRVAILNNGATKGGAVQTFRALRQFPIDVWQLHSSSAAGAENFSPARTANLDESTAHWIKLSANEDGSFKVTNGRTQESIEYGKR